MASSSSASSTSNALGIVCQPISSAASSTSFFDLGSSNSSSSSGHSSLQTLITSPEVPKWKRDLLQRRREQQLQQQKRQQQPQQQQQQQQQQQEVSPNNERDATTLLAANKINNSSLAAEATSSEMRLDTTDVAPKVVTEADCKELQQQQQQQQGKSKCRSGKQLLDIVELTKMRVNSANKQQQHDWESDSSEELQYGPGIVHRLRSKYLNMTLREMNKNRTTVQQTSFRRAASLEDLLGHKEETAAEKSACCRRYAKRQNVIGAGCVATAAAAAAAKVERYRNASKGNESTMKRARSVETLMRCNSSTPEEKLYSIHHATPGRVASNSALFEQENDHIILVDRSAVKIESRLLSATPDKNRSNSKPKRVKPVLAETERPPPDLVRTTMRMFESSQVKKLKPKGEVAVKVATFKTINDTFKAQNQKKIIPKPPLQPKPFVAVVNGNQTKLATSSSRRATTTTTSTIASAKKATSELNLIEKRSESNSEHRRNDGVITDPIVSSVFSVVSKFQQISVKSRSPSLSPEPSKIIKSSPTPSPEPSSLRAKAPCLDLKSPPGSVAYFPTPPIPSPRTQISPKLQSPSSPKTGLEIKPHLSTLAQKSNDFTSLTGNKIDLEQTDKVEHCAEENKDEEQEEQSKKTSKSGLNDQSDSSAECKTTVAAALSDSVTSFDSTLLVESSFDDVLTSDEMVDSPNRTVSKSALDNISKAGVTVQFSFNDNLSAKSYLPRRPPIPLFTTAASNTVTTTTTTTTATLSPQSSIEELQQQPDLVFLKLSKSSTTTMSPSTENPSISDASEITCEISKSVDEAVVGKKDNHSTTDSKQIGNIVKSTMTTSYSQGNESKTIKSQKSESNSPPQKQIGIIRPLVSTKTQLPQQNLSNRVIEKNMINRVKSIEQPTKVVVSLKSAEEIQPVKINNSNSSVGVGMGVGVSGGGLWDAKPWNQQNNTMVFNFSNRKDVPDYIENDGLIIKRKREKSKQPPQHQQQKYQQQFGDSDVIESNIDCLHLTDDSDTEISVDPPSPCDVAFCNDNVLINGRSNLSRTPRNHQHRIQFDDTATRTFEYPSEASMLASEGVVADNSNMDGGISSGDDEAAALAVAEATRQSGTLPSLLGGGGNLSSYTPSKVDLATEGFELGITRTNTVLPQQQQQQQQQPQQSVDDQVDCLKPSQDPGAWGQETAADMLY